MNQDRSLFFLQAALSQKKAADGDVALSLDTVTV